MYQCKTKYRFPFLFFYIHTHTHTYTISDHVTFYGGERIKNPQHNEAYTLKLRLKNIF